MGNRNIYSLVALWFDAIPTELITFQQSRPVDELLAVSGNLLGLQLWYIVMKIESCSVVLNGLGFLELRFICLSIQKDTIH